MAHSSFHSWIVSRSFGSSFSPNFSHFLERLPDSPSNSRHTDFLWFKLLPSASYSSFLLILKPLKIQLVPVITVRESFGVSKLSQFIPFSERICSCKGSDWVIQINRLIISGIGFPKIGNLYRFFIFLQLMFLGHSLLLFFELLLRCFIICVLHILGKNVEVWKLNIAFGFCSCRFIIQQKGVEFVFHEFIYITLHNFLQPFIIDIIVVWV